MDTIIQVKGNVKFKITLDSSVWIFDDRKLDLTTYFDTTPEIIDEDEKYLEDAGKFWSREIMEGAAYPPTLKTERKFDRQAARVGTFGIIAKPFINNAEPNENATTVTFLSAHNEEFTFPIEEAKKLIFKFSQDGAMLTEDGPIHILFHDGSNRENPITNIVGMRID